MLNLKLLTQLQTGLSQAKLSMPETAQLLLLDYIELLIKWNKAYNLTAIREPAAMITRHLLDSLSIAPYVTGQQNLDVGTGAGLPGIPLAIYAPQQHFNLLDSNGKKTRFLVQAKQLLKLPNITITSERVEALKVTHGSDHIISRAFSSLQQLINCTQHLLAPTGTWLAMKGTYPDAELAALPSNIQLEQVIPLQVPGLNEPRHLVIISRKDIS